MKKIFLIFVILAVALTMFVFPVQAKMVLKLGHVAPKISNEGKFADKFAELVVEKTKGEIVIEVFPSAQLGKTVAMLDSTILGNQDIYFGGNVELERFVPGQKLLNIPFSVRDHEHFRKFLASPLWEEIFVDPLEKVGLKVLGSGWERGPFRIMVSKKPVKSSEDLIGLKLRIASIESWRRAWTALGCNPVVLPWGDVYLGLRQGIVDAVTSPISLLYSMKFTEVAKYVIRTNTYWGLITVEMNKKKFDSLKPEYQKVLIDAINEAGNYYNELQAKSANEDLEKMKQEHGIDYHVLDTKPLAEKMQPAIRKMEKDEFIPAGLYDRINAL